MYNFNCFSCDGSKHNETCMITFCFLNDRYVYLCLLAGSILAIDTCFKQKVTDIIMYVGTYAIIYVIKRNRYEYACNGPYCRLSLRCICIHTRLKCLHVHLYVTN